jgi:hypothetical protein
VETDPRAQVVVRGGVICLGRRVTVSFHRTLRVPDNGDNYPLPPSFGRMMPYACAAHRNQVPRDWLLPDSFFIPLHQREALWLGFDGQAWHPSALVIGAEGVNVITGEPWDVPLSASAQNYVVVPDQPWLDGIRTATGLVRQFIAVPLGEGFTLSEQMQTTSTHHGIQLRVHEAKPGRFAEESPQNHGRLDDIMPQRTAVPGRGLGIGAGGAIVQRIYPDPYGIASWEIEPAACAHIQIVNSAEFATITGELPPPSPISAADYTANGLPWFELWDEERGDLGSHPALERIRSIGTIDASRSRKRRERPIPIADAQIKKIGRGTPPRSPKR